MIYRMIVVKHQSLEASDDEGKAFMTDISLRSVRKSYGEIAVIHGVDLEIEAGEFVVLVGPSGCGKSTLLRMIAGLERITGGDLTIAGKKMRSTRT
jgi:ABC-type sugar transport system ATPase subunit